MRADPHRMVEWLGVKSAASEQEILRIVEERLAASVIKRLLGLGLERAEIDATVIPSRTLQHRRSRRERLTLEESDRVLRLVRILSAAEAVYGNRERALGWLRRPHPRLDGRSPISLVKTDTGKSDRRRVAHPD